MAKMSAASITEDKIQTLNDGTKINYCSSGNGDHVVLLMPGALGTGRTDFTPQLEGDDGILIPADETDDGSMFPLNRLKQYWSTKNCRLGSPRIWKVEAAQSNISQ